MDGFKNSTKVQYMKGGACEGYAKGGKVKGAAKINKVMGEFKRGQLHSGSKEGPKVTSRKQATAIALSEAREAGAKIPAKKFGDGGAATKKGAPKTMSVTTVKKVITPVEGTSARPRDAKGRPLTMRDMLNANRDVGGLSAADMARTAAQVARANRMPVERIPTDAEAAALMMPRKKGGGVGSYKSEPLVGKGGLSAMPHGKKR